MMTKEEVITLMESSRNDLEWNQNVSYMLQDQGGYPSYWYNEVILPLKSKNFFNDEGVKI